MIFLPFFITVISGLITNLQSDIFVCRNNVSHEKKESII